MDHDFEGDKQHRVRLWMEGIQKFRPDLTFPVAHTVLKVLIESNPAIPAKERGIAVNLAKKIEVLLGVAPPPAPARQFDQRIVDVTRNLYLTGNYVDAVRRAYVELINEVKRKAETPPTLDGVALMNKVFSKDSPILKASGDSDQQEGCMNLFKGAVSMIRNPPSHSNQIKMDKDEADDLLWFATYLFRVLDNTTKTNPSQT